MCEVFFVEAGSGVIYIDAKEYPLLTRNCVAIKAGEVHEVVNSDVVVAGIDKYL